MGRPRGKSNKKKVELTDVEVGDIASTLPKEKKSSKSELKRIALQTEDAPVNKEKQATLHKLMNEINRDRGKTALKFASSEETPDRISFGDPELDELTGGGIPHKRFSIVWGAKSAGKSTLCYNVIAEAQKQGKICAYIDMERTFDGAWAIKQGVNLQTLVLGSEYATAENAMDDFIRFTKSGAVDLVILDSIQALSPTGEQQSKKGKEKSLEDDTMALLARKLSQFFRISSSSVYTGNVAILLIGQARTNLGGFVAFDSLSGGHALNHWSSMTLHIGRGAKADAPIEKIKVDGKTEDKVIGFNCVVKLEKIKISSKLGDKTTPEGTNVNLPFYFESGFKKGNK
jgi:recombination protein RecA